MERKQLQLPAGRGNNRFLLVLAAAGVIGFACWYFLFSGAGQGLSKAAISPIGTPSKASETAGATTGSSEQTAVLGRDSTSTAIPVPSDKDRIARLWAEFSLAKSASAFFEKYKNWPADSSERFAAEWKVLSCGSLTSMGLERFYGIAERQKANLAADAQADEARRRAQEGYVSLCKEFIGALSVSDIKARQAALLGGNSIESRAMRVADRATAGARDPETLAELESVLSSENPFAIQAVAKVWGAWAHSNAKNLSDTPFQGMNKQVSEYAWLLASCNFGMPCDRTHELVEVDCMYSRQCGAETLEEHLRRYRLSGEEAMRVARLRDEIVRAIGRRDLRSLGIK